MITLYIQHLSFLYENVWNKISFGTKFIWSGPVVKYVFLQSVESVYLRAYQTLKITTMFEGKRWVKEEQNYSLNELLLTRNLFSGIQAHSSDLFLR